MTTTIESSILRASALISDLHAKGSIEMAYSLPFGRNVNQLIGRYAVGYPSDRIKKMMARVERIEYQVPDKSIDETFVWKFVKWSEFFGPRRNGEFVYIRKLLATEFLTEDNAV